MKKIRKEARGFVLGVLMCVLVMGFAVPAIAANLTKTIDVTYRDIKLVINGETIAPKDGNGTTVEPFVYNGTTYLPVRAVGEAIGYTVGWDNNTSTVSLTGGGASSQPTTPTTVNMIDTVGAPYDKTDSYVEAYTSTGTGSITMGGTAYKNSFSVRCPSGKDASGYASFNLGGKYTMLTGKFGIVDDTGTATTDTVFTINIYGDGQLLKSVSIKNGSLPSDFSVDVRGVSSLKFDVPTPASGYATYIGFADLKLQ
ncbi:NPCBM/NEW2 domain-containing protein [Oscillospiraceae bacterium OttesenSCG-928-F05]|nr:NPCBM/NEW2 domain-containing protein [Oscillospiraceae bacterium OttesenSCG-928-F05]